MSDELSQAETAADAARSRLIGTASTVKARLSPAALKGELIEKVQSRAIEVTGDLAETMRKRPALTAGIIATAALILFRKPVFGVLRRLTKEK